MAESGADQEALREALVTLERLRARAERERSESDVLLNGLSAILEPGEPDEIFSKMFDSFRALIPLEEALVLTPVPLAPDTLRCISATWLDGQRSQWRVARMFQRILSGKSTVVPDATRIPEFAAQPAAITDRAGSALLVALSTPDGTGMLILLHPQRKVFNRDHLRLLERFAVLAAQTLANVETRRLRQQTREMSEAIAAAQVADQQRKRFMATLSHEIRTPLTGVLGITELLLETRLGEEQRQMADIIRDQASCLRVLLNDMLDFSKLDSGAMRLDPRPFEIRPLINNVIGLQSGKALTKSVRVLAVIDPNVPTIVRNDPDRVRQIVQNLVNNAVKFTDEGAIIVDVGVEREGWVRITVSDTGCGIPEDKQATLFQPFTQADDSPSRRVGGTGLGLAICAQLAETMGGTLTLQSAPGAGSRFTLAAPMPTCQDASALPTLSCPAHLLERNQAYADSLWRLLSQWDVHPTSTADPNAVWLVSGDHFSGRALEAWLTVNPARTRRTVLLLDPRQPLPNVPVQVLRRPVTGDRLHQALSAVLDPPTPKITTPPTGLPNPVVAPPVSLSVLIAEDNPVNQRILRAFVEKAGHTVTLASDGQEALQRAGDVRPDLILMDVQMPIMDGLTATRALRERGWTGPIWAFTANAYPEQINECLEAGMNGYLTKPVDRAALRQLLVRQAAEAAALQKASA